MPKEQLIKEQDWLQNCNLFVLLRKFLVMKYSFFTLFFLIAAVGFSQNEPPKMPKYVSKNAAGIFYYDINDAFDKIKLKDDEKKASASKVIRNYNDEVKKISFLNTPKLAEVDLTVNSIGEQAFRDRDLANQVRKMIEETVVPVRDSVIAKEKILNTDLEKILSSKQYKKWLRYQRSEKEKLLPKAPQNNQQQNNGGMMQRNMRGMGGMGGRRF